MTKLFKKIISITIALAMVVVTPVTAFAADWYLKNGDILIEADESGQYVTQGESHRVADDAPVITGVMWDVQIKVETEGDAAAEFTIKNILVENLYQYDDRPLSTIDIGDSKAEMTVEGDNNIRNENEEGYAAIHVGSGELTIKGDGYLTIEADSHGAKIGSNQYEDMSGTIHITDNVGIYTAEYVDEDGYSYGTGDGAAIGSGEGGDFTGEIIIDGKAVVEAESNDCGAGIGTGQGDTYYDEEGNEYWGGDFRGNVTIGGNAAVYAEGNDDSAGIGSGEDGTFSGGSITIKDNAFVTAIGSKEGPGIGAADDTTLDGDIIIKDSAEVDVGGGSSAPDIGSDGGIGGDKGSISILGNAKVYALPMILFDEDGDPVYDENGDPVCEENPVLVIGTRYAERTENEYEDSETEETVVEILYPFGGKIRIGSDVTLNGISGKEVFENQKEHLDVVEVNYENEFDFIFNIIDIVLENEIKIPSGNVSEVSEEIPEGEANPNTGAPVVMNVPNVVFVLVAVTAKNAKTENFI